MDEGEDHDQDYSVSDLSGRDGSDSESTQSTPEEERIRRLFLTVDSDGDGFITSNDILSVCHQLDLEFSPEEIMYQLGADEDGKISFDDFVRRRLELMEETKAQTCSVRSSEDEEIWSLDMATNTRDFGRKKLEMSLRVESRGREARGSPSIPGSSSEDEGHLRWVSRSGGSGRGSDSLEASSSAKHESSSWEFDSGAHDLDTEQITLRRLLETSGVTIPNDNSDLLEIANKYHQNALSSLKQEAFELNGRLQLVLKERDLLEKQNIVKQREENRLVKELERKRHRDCQKYEDRITELSTIIVELSEKVESQRYTVFNEEDEYSQQSEEETVPQSPGSGKTRKMPDSLREWQEIKSRMKTLSVENRSLKVEVKKREEAVERLNQLLKTSKKNNEKLSSSETSHSKEEVDIDAALGGCIQTILSSCDKKQVVECVQLEMDKLKFKLLHLHSQLDLIHLHLEESQANSERLTVLLGKYESNNTALQLALNYSDHVAEAQDVVNSLLESEMGLLLASCRAAGLGKLVTASDQEEKAEITTILERARERRAKAEAKARQFMEKMNFNGKPTASGRPYFSKEDESRLYEYINECQTDVLSIRKSLVDVEPLHEDSLTAFGDLEANSMNSQKHDLENVVLMQELMSLKEEKAELRAQLFVSEKEKTALNLQLNSNQSLQKTYVTEIDRLKAEFQMLTNSKMKGHSEDSRNSEVRLKGQVQELMASLNQVAKNYDRHIEEYAAALETLKKENTNLKFKLERLKRKQDIRSKRSDHKEVTSTSTFCSEARHGNPEAIQGLRRMAKETTL